MSAKAKTKAKKPAVEVPADAQRANVFINEIGEALAARARLQVGLAEAYAKVKATFEEQAKPHAETIERRMKGLHAWAEAHRAALTEDGKTQTVRLAVGEIAWRRRPPSVRIDKGMADAVLEHLILRKLDRFVRVKREIDKEALIADATFANTLRHVVVGSTGEDFVCKPFGAELEEVL